MLIKYYMKKETKAVANTITDLFCSNDGRVTPSGYTAITQVQYDSIPNPIKDPDDNTNSTWKYKWVSNAYVTI